MMIYLGFKVSFLSATLALWLQCSTKDANFTQQTCLSRSNEDFKCWNLISCCFLLAFSSPPSVFPLSPLFSSLLWDEQSAAQVAAPPPVQLRDFITVCTAESRTAHTLTDRVRVCVSTSPAETVSGSQRVERKKEPKKLTLRKHGYVFADVFVSLLLLFLASFTVQ